MTVNSTNDITTQEIDFLTRCLVPDMRVLDAGCGRGNLLDAAARIIGRSGAVVGLDISLDALAVSRRRSALNKNSGVEWADLSLGIPWEDESFDVVLCHRLFEELQDPEFFICEVSRILREGGLLAAVTAIRPKLNLSGPDGAREVRDDDRRARLASAIRDAGLVLDSWQFLNTRDKYGLSTTDNTVIGLYARKRRME